MVRHVRMYVLIEVAGLYHGTWVGSRGRGGEGFGLRMIVGSCLCMSSDVLIRRC